MCSMFSVFNGFKNLKLFGRDPFKLLVHVFFWGKTGETTMKLYGWWGSISCYTSRFYNRCWGQTAEAENRGKNNQLDCASMLGTYLQAHCFISFSQGVEWRVSRWFIFKESGNGCLYLQPWAIWQTDKSPNSCSSHPHEPLTHCRNDTCPTRARHVPMLTWLVGMHAMSPKWFNFYGFKSEEVLIIQLGKLKGGHIRPSKSS